MKFATKPVWHYLPHLRYVATLAWGIKNSVFCRYSADVEENANDLHFKCTDFNSSTRVTVYAECIYVFFKSKSCHRCWIPCLLLTNTAVTSAVTNFRCHKLIAKVNKWKNSDTRSVWGKLAILNTEHIQICGCVTKLEAIKMQFVRIFFHICWISAENLNF